MFVYNFLCSLERKSLVKGQTKHPSLRVPTSKATVCGWWRLEPDSHALRRKEIGCDFCRTRHLWPTWNWPFWVLLCYWIQALYQLSLAIQSIDMDPWFCFIVSSSSSTITLHFYHNMIAENTMWRMNLHVHDHTDRSIMEMTRRTWQVQEWRWGMALNHIQMVVNQRQYPHQLHCPRSPWFISISSTGIMPTLGDRPVKIHEVGIWTEPRKGYSELLNQSPTYDMQCSPSTKKNKCDCLGVWQSQPSLPLGNAVSQHYSLPNQISKSSCGKALISPTLKNVLQTIIKKRETNLI